MKKLIIILLLLIPILAWPQITEAKKLGLIESVIKLNIKFSPRLFVVLVERYCKNPKHVLAQACHETGWFTSYNCQKRNNFFGMKLTKNRIAIGTENEYSIYAHWAQSILDYSLWQKRYYKGQNYTNYLEGYAEDKEYINKVKEMLKCSKFAKLIDFS